MRTEEIKIYKFEELSDSAKDKAVEWYAGHGLDYEWWDWVYMRAEEFGLKITSFELDQRQKITIRMDKSQTDYAQVVINEFSIPNDPERKPQPKLRKIDFDHFFECQEFVEKYKPLKEKYDAANCDDDEYGDLETKLEIIENNFESDIKQYWLSVLNAEADYLTSREVIEGNIISNEYEFREDGSIF